MNVTTTTNRTLNGRSRTSTSVKRKGASSLLNVSLLLTLMVGCGSSKPDAYDAGRSIATLRAAGWRPKSVAGMPNTLSGVRQVGYLEVTAPDGTRIDIQFLEDTTKAVLERKAVEAEDKKFIGSTARNALVFAADLKHAIAQPDLDRLTKLLRH